MTIKRLILVVLPLLALLTVGCTDNIESPTRTDSVPGAPEIPRDVQTRVGDGQIELSWSLNNPALARQFLIYRKDTTNASVTLLDSTSEYNHLDLSVRNDVRYIYQVATHGTNNLVSKLSDPVSATPGLFSILINDGHKYTSNTSVTVSVAALSASRYLLLSNDSLFATGDWVSFVEKRDWELESGDGAKTVYAKFRDYEGNETIKYVSDEIILDTRAIIDSLTLDPRDVTLQANMELHFRLYAGETEGVAGVEIPVAGLVELFDDGTGGDAVADDGIYERDWQVPEAIDIINQLVVGNFVDAANNQADAQSSVTFLNIANPPAPVTLSGYTVSDTEVELVWTVSAASDFSSYLLFRGDDAAVDTSGQLLYNETSSAGIRFTNVDLEPQTSYFYVVYTLDRSGLLSASNVVKVTTEANEDPEPVTLYASNVSARDVVLGWTQNNDDDFASYRIYRSTLAGVAQTANNLRGVVTTQGATSFTDSDVTVSTSYYYIVVVFDEWDKPSVPSNEVKVTTKAADE